MSTGTKPAARLDASLLLARKGEASPAIVATQHNNPGLAWGEARHPEDFQGPQSHGTPSKPVPNMTARLRTESLFARQKKRMRPASYPQGESVLINLHLQDDTYLRLKYLSQKMPATIQNIITNALRDYLERNGVPKTRNIELVKR